MRKGMVENQPPNKHAIPPFCCIKRTIKTIRSSVTPDAFFGCPVLRSPPFQKLIGSNKTSTLTPRGLHPRPQALDRETSSS